MKKAWLAMALLAAPAMAQRAPVPVASAAEVALRMDTGNTLETRVDGDLNGDGEIDTVFIERGDDKRKLTALVAYQDQFDNGHDPLDPLTLDPYPLGPASLSIAKGVLKVVDLTGGTTATQATYRYRYDIRAKNLRLIGLDGTLYSRTFGHDGFEFSWNLLTGDMVTRELKLNHAGGDAAYGPAVERRSKRPSKPLYLANTPSPDDVIASLRR